MSNFKLVTNRLHFTFRTKADNRQKKRRKEVQSRIDFTEFCLLNNGNQGQHVVSPQLVLVAYQYLSTCKFFFLLP